MLYACGDRSPCEYRSNQLDADVVSEWTALANAGETDCQYSLGLHYMGTDHPQSTYWLKKSLDGGNANAALLLAVEFAAKDNPNRNLGHAEHYARIAVSVSEGPAKQRATLFLKQTLSHKRALSAEDQSQ